MNSKTKKTVAKAKAQPAAKKTVVSKSEAAPKSTGKHAKKSANHSAVAKIKARIAAKKRHWFKGRFGKKSVRRLSIEKWQKWRRPRGIDVHFRKEDGLVVDTGYKTPNAIRSLHPSGLAECRVFNENDLAGMQNVVIRIGSTVGKRKRKQIRLKAKEMGLRVLN